MVSVISRWTIAAALVVAAVIATAAIERAWARGPAPNPQLEARVLSRTFSYLEERHAAGPGNPVVGARLVDDHLLAFRLDSDPSHLARAEELAERVARLSLDTATSHARLSLARLSMHDFTGAIEAVETAVAADPRDEAALGVLFDAALAGGRYDRAGSALATLGEHHPESLTHRLRVARWTGATEGGTAAERLIEPLCAGLESGSARRAIVAWCETLAGDLAATPEAAARWYRRALETQPNYPAALEGLADQAYARADWTEARKLYQRVLVEAHPDLYLRLAEVSRALGEPDRAAGYERDFLRLAERPGAEALNAHSLARFYAAREETRERALAVARRDVERRPSVETYAVLAWVHLKRGEPEAALAASDGSRTWGAPSASDDYLRGRILGMLGQEEEARALLGSALAREPELEPHVLVELRGLTPDGPGLPGPDRRRR